MQSKVEILELPKIIYAELSSKIKSLSEVSISHLPLEQAARVIGMIETLKVPLDLTYEIACYASISLLLLQNISHAAHTQPISYVNNSTASEIYDRFTNCLNDNPAAFLTLTDEEIANISGLVTSAVLLEAATNMYNVHLSQAGQIVLLVDTMAHEDSIVKTAELIGSFTYNVQAMQFLKSGQQAFSNIKFIKDHSSGYDAILAKGVYNSYTALNDYMSSLVLEFAYTHHFNIPVAAQVIGEEIVTHLINQEKKDECINKYSTDDIVSLHCLNLCLMNGAENAWENSYTQLLEIDMRGAICTEENYAQHIQAITD